MSIEMEKAELESLHRKILKFCADKVTAEEINALLNAKFRITPKKVEDDSCPLCGTDGKDDNDVPGDWCPNCGQRLDWSKDE